MKKVNKPISNREKEDPLHPPRSFNMQQEVARSQIQINLKNLHLYKEENLICL